MVANSRLRKHRKLSMAELEMIHAHTAACSKCLLAYQAAQVLLRLLQERASVIVEPPPFFQTKVMAAIREQKLAPKRLGFLNCGKLPGPSSLQWERSWQCFWH